MICPFSALPGVRQAVAGLSGVALDLADDDPALLTIGRGGGR